MVIFIWDFAPACLSQVLDDSVKMKDHYFQHSYI